MKEKTIIIDGQPFTYIDETGDPYVFEDWTPANGDAILRLSARLLREAGIDFFLAFGTLLGAVREGKCIDGDGDVDIVITDEQRLRSCLPHFQKEGLLLNRVFDGDLYSFHTADRRGHIDMYVMSNYNIPRCLQNRYTRICGHIFPKKYIKDILKESGDYRLGGMSYPIPANPERVLRYWYGHSWRIPQQKQANEDIYIIRLCNLMRRIQRKAKRIMQCR